MTLEELQSQIEELKAEKDAVNSKNKELLAELKQARNKNKEIDSEAFYKALDEVDSLKAEKEKLNQVLGLKNKEVEKLSTNLNELNTNLKTTKLENTLNEELSKLGLKPTSLRLVKAALKAESKFSDDGDVLIGDKPVGDYLKEWSATEEARDAMLPSGNVGSGASGGNNTSQSVDISKMTPTQMMEYGRNQK